MVFPLIAFAEENRKAVLSSVEIVFRKTGIKIALAVN